LPRNIATLPRRASDPFTTCSTRDHHHRDRGQRSDETQTFPAASIGDPSRVIPTKQPHVGPCAVADPVPQYTAHNPARCVCTVSAASHAAQTCARALAVVVFATSPDAIAHI
jgi:hypothetical protein